MNDNKLLQMCIIEENSCGKYVKIRLHPEEWLTFVESIGILCSSSEGESEIVDEFFDRDFLYGNEGHFIRRRTMSGVEKIVFQKCKEITTGCRIYEECEVDPDEEDYQNVTSILKYTFNRKYFSLKDDTIKDLVVYHDSIQLPIKYDVVSLKKKIFQTDKEYLIKVLTDILSLIGCTAHHMPCTYSKFMYILQCTPMFRKYDEIYANFDGADNCTSDHVSRALEAKEQSKDLICYLWQSCFQIERLQHFFSLGHSIEKCYEVINEQRESIYSSDNVKLMSCDPYCD